MVLHHNILGDLFLILKGSMIQVAKKKGMLEKEKLSDSTKQKVFSIYWKRIKESTIAFTFN